MTRDNRRTICLLERKEKEALESLAARSLLLKHTKPTALTPNPCKMTNL